MSLVEDGGAPLSFVEDDETLYRSISVERRQCVPKDDGSWRLSSQAFTDSSQKPSVDRACLCDNDPTRALKSPRDGIVSLIAHEVRSIKNFTQTKEGKPLKNEDGQELMHVFDVVHDPITEPPKNPAHALIVTSPSYASRSAFNRLIERLGRIAETRGWIITPQEQQ